MQVITGTLVYDDGIHFLSKVVEYIAEVTGKDYDRYIEMMKDYDTWKYVPFPKIMMEFNYFMKPYIQDGFEIRFSEKGWGIYESICGK